MTEGEHSMEDRARIFAPVLAQVKRLADEGKPVAIAIDGRCGSGKRTATSNRKNRVPQCTVAVALGDDRSLPELVERQDMAVRADRGQVSLQYPAYGRFLSALWETGPGLGGRPGGQYGLPAAPR